MQNAKFLFLIWHKPKVYP